MPLYWILVCLTICCFAASSVGNCGCLCKFYNVRLCECLHRLMYAYNRPLLTYWSEALRYMLWQMLHPPGVRWIVFLHSRQILTAGL